MEARLYKQDVQTICRSVLQPSIKDKHIRAWLVGGCVRDMIHDEGINDIDVICTDAQGMVEALDQYFHETHIEHSIHAMKNEHAIVISIETKYIFDGFRIIPDKVNIEVSQLDYLDRLSVDDALRQDALERDFICNAWYMEVGDDKPFIPFSTIYDTTGKYIHPCNGTLSISDNPLRIFRAMDLMCRGYRPTGGLYKAISTYLDEYSHPDIYDVACLQVVDKVFNRLATNNYRVWDVIYAFNYLAELGVWGRMIHPAFADMIGCIHNNRYHHDSVWQHTMNVIYNMARRDVHGTHRSGMGVIRPTSYDYWAALLHDIGKPCTMTTDADGATHFYDHQTASVRLAEEILKSSPLNKRGTDTVLKLIAHHMDTKVFGDEPIKPTQYKHIRRLQWELGAETFDHFLVLNHADCAASERSTNNNTPNVMKAVIDMVCGRGESAWDSYTIPVTGNDIKKAFPDEPGVNIGMYIKQLYKVTFSRPEDYVTKEQCLHYIGTLIKTGWVKKANGKEPSVSDFKK